MEFEKTILFNLATNPDYTQQVNSHLRKDFFDNIQCREIFSFMNEYINEFKAQPTKSIIQHEITKSSKYNEKQFEEVLKTVDEVFDNKEKQNVEWLVKETELYCQKISAENATIKCMDIVKSGKNKDSILEIMKEALRVEFNSDSGIDFFNEDSIEKRFERYNDKGSYFPTGLTSFDAVLGGGLKAKTITLFLGLTHAGKSVNMINITANQLRLGTNVAYFTLEMSEDEISQRVEANLLNVEINDIKYLEKEIFKSKLQKLKELSYGKLMIKEFPTSYGSVTDIERTLDDWQIKNNFKPDVIVIDYINIMKSVRIKEANNMYQLVKSISEEIRGLASKRNVALLSATQTNRGANESSNIGMGDTSESFGVPMSSDVYIALISTEALRQERIQVWKSLKNRNTGIIDYFFAMETQFQFSKVIDATSKVNNLNVIKNNNFMLNNNPETVRRVEDMKKRLNKKDNKTMDDDFNDDKFLNKSIKKKNKTSGLIFDDNDDFM